MESVQPQVLTVGQLNTYIKSVLEGDYHLRNIFVVGEISNFTASKNGHWYMTLKDQTGAMKAVMFRGSNYRLQFLPEDGMKVICFGSVSVYLQGGNYQFIVENMQPDGLGSLNLAFEQLKERLGKEGLFNPALKKPIPSYPKRIGVCTSPTAAAFQDICNVLRRRWPFAELVLAETLVQGDQAPPQICKALRQLDAAGVDVILVARGGGSIEDLWCFNDESVARTVFSMETPVVSGVGHETDFTIIDFVADQRAPTPSAAAELCTPDRLEEYEKTMLLKSRLLASMQNELKRNRTRVDALASSNVLKSMQSLINERRLRLDGLMERLQHKIGMELSGNRNRLSVAAGKLDAYAPLKVLSRGYSLSFTEEGKVIQSIKQVTPEDRININVSDGMISCKVESTKEDAHHG